MEIDPNFLAIVGSLHSLFECLRDMRPLNGALLPKAVPGVYLFSEDGAPLYVGRTNNVRNRYKAHLASSHRKAAFAMLLARKDTGRVATYKRGEGSRDWLMRDPDFMSAFSAAIARIRRMEFRYVEEECSIRQCLLEVYCSLIFKTPFNDFNNH